MFRLRVSIHLALVLGACNVLAKLPFSLSVNTENTGFSVTIGSLQLLKHSEDSPLVFVGSGATTFEETSGNFKVKDYTSERIGLRNFTTSCDDSSCKVRVYRGETYVTLRMRPLNNQPLVIEIEDKSFDFDRIWFRVVAEKDEEIYGGGEQFSYFNLRHRDKSGENVFPIWTREQGVGRNKTTKETFIADQQMGAGGDYYTTYYSQPTFVSSRKYFFHHEGTNYVVMDFGHNDFHEIFILGVPGKIHLNSNDKLSGVVESLTSLLGRMPDLPDWIQSGAILGVQGGTSMMLSRYQLAKKHNIPVSGLWIQDWSGKMLTPFGSRVNWSWKWDPSFYPELDQAIANLTKEGVRVLAYINPNLEHTGDLFQEAASKGYLVKNDKGDVYLSNSITLIFGTVDFTNPDAFNWYKNVIKTNMIGLGLGGWMADFGEYLPVDAKLFDGRSGLEVHNEWPVLWAKLNREALEETGKLGEVVFFSRAGFSGISNYTTLMWNGDQNVDFSLADGVRSTIYGTLSMAMSGASLCHFDIGGYTTYSQFALVRNKELFLRSAEYAVFTPVFRTHEGNQPEANVQWYSNGTIDAFAKLARMFASLSGYRQMVVEEAAATGMPAQRPMNLMFENVQGFNDQYMFGSDILVSPVYTEYVQEIPVFLPPNYEGYDWVHAWNHVFYSPNQTIHIKPLLGQPAVFYRSDSAFRATFDKLKDVAGIEADPVIG